MAIPFPQQHFKIENIPSIETKLQRYAMNHQIYQYK
jgi:hypothetical protein